MNIKHFFSIPLLIQRRTARRMEKARRLEQWAKYRYLLMLNNTLKSIENQIGGPSPTLIRVDQRYNPLINRLTNENPLPSWATIIDISALQYTKQLAKDPKENWTHVYLTRVDSDDLMGINVKRLVLSKPPKYRSLNFNTGFLYNARSKVLTAYHHPSPPFYTDIYSRAELLSGNYPKRKGGHNCILPGGTKLLPAFNFCIVCHHTQFQDSSTWEKLRRAAKSKLRSSPIALQQRINQELSKFWNLEAFGCPHYEVRFRDKLDVHTIDRLSTIRLGRTPVITRSRSLPPGVHGRSNKSSPYPSWQPKTTPRRSTQNSHSKMARIQPVAPPRRRPKMPVQSNRTKKDLTRPIVTRTKTPKMTRNTIRGDAIAKEHKRLRSPFGSRTNIKQRLRKGERNTRLGYKLLRRQK